jgi:hypothetical protein
MIILLNNNRTDLFTNLKTITMKMLSLLPGIILFVTLIISAKAQNTYTGGVSAPGFDGLLYGNDVLIKGNIVEDQREASLKVAPNGWLYSCFLISNGGMYVARSTDNGMTWTHSHLLQSNMYLSQVDLVVTGSDAGSIKIFAASSGFYKSMIDIWKVSVDKLNADLTLAGSTEIDNVLSNTGYSGLAIATDESFPSPGSNPFSIGVLFSKKGIVPADSIVFVSSGNAGQTWPNHQLVTYSVSAHGRVSLSYGRSPSQPTGSYFAAWEEKNISWDIVGKIMTAHTIASFNGSFSVPVRLDPAGSTTAGRCRNPRIASQFSDMNNDAGNFTVVCMFDVDNSLAGKHFDVKGAYTKDPFAASGWTQFNLAASADNEFQPDIIYNQVSNQFYVTWSDSTNQKLSCAMQNLNLSTPDTWTILSNGYNDLGNMIAPYPKIAYNPVTQQVSNVWIREVSSTNGNVVFDMDFLPVGIGYTASFQPKMEIFPNPCNDITTISVTLPDRGHVNLVLRDLNGKLIYEKSDEFTMAGNHVIILNTSSFVPGLYVCTLVSGKSRYVTKLEIVR